MKTRCPDCGEQVEIDALRTVMGFLECPACAVGSPALAWLRVCAGDGRKEAQKAQGEAAA